MRFFIAFFLLNSWLSVEGQNQLVLLKDTTFKTYSRFSTPVDSTIVKNNERYDYYSINSKSLVPFSKGFSKLQIRIKNEIFEQLSSDGKTILLSQNLKDKKLKILFKNPTEPLKNFHTWFDIELKKNILSMKTNESFYGVLKLPDVHFRIIIRPYMVAQRAIKIFEGHGEKFSFVEYLEFNEPFELGNNYYKLSSLDLSTRTIELDTVSYEDSREGYKIGKRVIDFDNIKGLLINNVNTNSKKIESSAYYLFYFWGEWCQPCLKKMDYNKKLFDALEPKKINFINYALSINEESELRTLEIIQKKQIKGFHFIDGQNKVPLQLIKKLNIHVYPSYVVLSNRGDVLYRSDVRKQESIEEFLNANGLLKYIP